MVGPLEGVVRSLEFLSNQTDVVHVNSEPMEFSPELYVRSRAVVSRLIAGETLVLPVRGDVGDLASFYTLNKTATTVWDALERPRSFAEICDVIEQKYEISKEKAETEMLVFVREMCSLGLVKVALDREGERQ
jgi:Coenzyme PQQ synthesis protein D (PqqD)